MSLAENVPAENDFRVINEGHIRESELNTVKSKLIRKPLKNAPLETDKSILNMLILQTNIFGMELVIVFWVKRKLFKIRTNFLKIGENVLILERKLCYGRTKVAGLIILRNNLKSLMASTELLIASAKISSH